MPQQPPSPPHARPVEYSTFLARAAAHIVDRILIGTVIWAVGVHILGLDPNQKFSALFELALLSVFFVYCHGRWGATPGKMLMQLRVISIDGKPISYSQALLRYSPYIAMGCLLAVLPEVDFKALTESTSAETKAALPLEWQIFLNLNICWYVVSVIYMLQRKDRRTLHDVIAYTVVVAEKNERSRD